MHIRPTNIESKSSVRTCMTACMATGILMAIHWSGVLAVSRYHIRGGVGGVTPLREIVATCVRVTK